MFAPPAKRRCSLKLEDDFISFWNGPYVFFEHVDFGPPFFFRTCWFLIFRGGKHISFPSLTLGRSLETATIWGIRFVPRWDFFKRWPLRPPQKTHWNDVRGLITNHGPAWDGFKGGVQLTLIFQFPIYLEPGDSTCYQGIQRQGCRFVPEKHVLDLNIGEFHQGLARLDLI